MLGDESVAVSSVCRSERGKGVGVAAGSTLPSNTVSLALVLISPALLVAVHS